MRNLSVPLLKQKRLECGPTALRMVLHYFGEKVSSGEIIGKIGGIKRYGVRTIALADFAKRAGFKVECYSYNKRLAKGKAEVIRPDKTHILRFLKKRLPVIIAVRAFLLFDGEPTDMGHFIVITKYEKGRFWYNDPEDGKQHRIKENDLMFAWLNNVVDSSAYLLVLHQKH